ncbi:2-dehydro-3-deoxygalactonokinase [Roseovarius sp. SYSU LYC5161]|uniref:2-dehydro-3-deoxygalactonokinase n=1 Tax=Roseovarius halophilus (ex Wu et al. 2025) TaxID=3376060 RepID=UPI00287223A0|nr:2-dehydro-3-deoxygalactonokinase [Roseovarius sp.]
MTDWIAIGPDTGGTRAVAMRGGRVDTSLVAPDEAAAVTRLGTRAENIIRVGDGAPDRLPAAVMPARAGTVAGFTQETPADVIGAWVRVRIAGFLGGHPNWDGVLCVVEDEVTHWIHISADEAVSSQSFLTRRLINALDAGGPADTGAIADCLSRPERLAAHLRAAQVGGDGAAMAGYLIGAELAAARPYWLGQQVAIISEPGQAAGYAAALSAQGVPVIEEKTETLLAAGLGAVAAAWGLSG